MIIIDAFFWITGILLLIVMFYLWFLAIVSLLPERKSVTFRRPRTRFAILIPAHNEAGIIGKTLGSIQQLKYPTDLFETYVIADNCTDETAGIARSRRATVLERRDKNRKGKGYALQWAFETLDKRGLFKSYDAFVIIDADTVCDTDFLRAMDIRSARGESVVQGYYDVLNPAESPMASLSFLGFALNRNLKYTGRTRIGSSSNLLGNGMCFSSRIIEQFGWDATSIVEDMEYAVMLRLGGVAVSFAPEARVYAAIPETFKGSRVQRSRWDIGRFQVRNKYIGKLIKASIRKKDLAYFDTAMELLIPPFSLFAVLSFSLFGLFLATHMTTGFHTLSRLWFTIVLSLVAYIMLGLITAKADRKTYINLIYAPFFLLWRVATIIWGYVHRIGGEWIKTDRKNVL